MDNDTGTELEQPLISVVIAVCNDQDTVGRAISSVLRQTHPNIEMVIVDDASTDNTSRVLEGYEALSRPGRVIRVLRRGNAGWAVARNTALEVVSGDFITFVDAEDTVFPNHLATLLGRYEDLATSEGGSRTVVCAHAFLCTTGGVNAGRLQYREKVPGSRRQRAVILDRNFGSLYGLFPRYFFAEVGVFDPEQVCVQAWELWLRAIYSGWRVDRVAQVTGITSRSQDSVQAPQECLTAGEERALRQTLRRFDGRLSAKERATVQRRLDNRSALAAAAQAERALREGRGEDTKKHLRRAAEMIPTQRRARLKSAIANLPGGTRWLVNRQRADDRRVGYTEHLLR